MTNKNQKAEDFVGWKSDDGLLEAVEILPREPYRCATYKVICTKCSKDKELFPDGYFVSTKGNLVKGRKPCGCSKKYNWSKDQYIIKLNRVWKGKIKILGFVGEFSDINSKVSCQCELEGHVWEASINPLLRGHGCPVCAVKSRTTKRKNKKDYIISNCEDVSKRNGYIFKGLIEDYRNSSSKIKFECPLHGDQIMSYSNYVNHGQKCPYCMNKKKEPYVFIKDIIKRCEKDNYKFVGFMGGYKTNISKISYLCPEHGIQTQRYSNFMQGAGCNYCAIRIRGPKRTDEQEALDKCAAICETEGYEPLGFVDGYKNAHKTRFEYKCPTHGKQNISYTSFVNQGSRCKICYKDKQKILGNRNGYYPDRKDEVDYLYILNFNGEFIKVGRSFDVDERMKGLRTESKVPIKKIHKLRIFTATHQEIYNLEQELHSELRERNFQHYVDWSTECFENSCLFILNKLLDNYGLEEVRL